MKIDIKTVVGIDDGVYKSALYNDYYAVDFYVLRDGVVLKMLYPYKTLNRANQMLEYLHGRTDVQPMLDYRREVWFVQESKKVANNGIHCR